MNNTVGTGGNICNRVLNCFFIKGINKSGALDNTAVFLDYVTVHDDSQCLKSL